MQANSFPVGSVVHFAKDNDIVWGSGVNGKIPCSSYKFSTLDCRATRGPLTRDFLKREFNVTSPEVFGDPALLLPIFCPELHKYICSNHQVTIVPNLNDFSKYNKSIRFKKKHNIKI